MSLIKQYKWYILVVVIVVLALYGSYRAGYAAHQPETITKVETKVVEKIVEKKIVIHDRSQTVTTTTKPDGTVVTSVTHNNIVTASDAKKKEKDDTKIKDLDVKSIPLPNYSLSADAESYMKYPLKPTVNIAGGYRLIGPFWAEISYNRALNLGGLGVRWELK